MRFFTIIFLGILTPFMWADDSLARNKRRPQTPSQTTQAPSSAPRSTDKDEVPSTQAGQMAGRAVGKSADKLASQATRQAQRFAATRDHILNTFDHDNRDEVDSVARGMMSKLNRVRTRLGGGDASPATARKCSKEACANSLEIMTDCMQIAAPKILHTCLKGGQESLSVAYNILHRQKDQTFTPATFQQLKKEILAESTANVSAQVAAGIEMEKRVVKTKYLEELSKYDDFERAALLIHVMALLSGSQNIYQQVTSLVEQLGNIAGLEEQLKGRLAKEGKKVASAQYDAAMSYLQDKAMSSASKWLEKVLGAINRKVDQIQNEAIRKVVRKAVRHLSCSAIFCRRFMNIAVDCILEQEESKDGSDPKGTHRNCAAAAFNQIRDIQELDMEKDAPKHPGALYIRFAKDFDKTQKYVFMLAAAHTARKRTPELQKVGAITPTVIAQWESVLKGLSQKEDRIAAETGDEPSDTDD